MSHFIAGGGKEGIVVLINCWDKLMFFTAAQLRKTPDIVFDK